MIDEKIASSVCFDHTRVVFNKKKKERKKGKVHKMNLSLSLLSQPEKNLVRWMVPLVHTQMRNGSVWG